jgi:quercetin dioxygenase-like cupin family protein
VNLDRRAILKSAAIVVAVFIPAKLWPAVRPLATVNQSPDPKQINQRSTTMFEKTPQYPSLPPDDPKRNLTIAQPDTDQSLPHIGVVGDTYTITVSGDETNGRFCVIDMHIPPGGGPGPHRHDFEETFILLEGEVEATFRGKKSIVKAGDTINIPSNAPHQFHNSSSSAARLLCICSPAGQENFFMELGVKVATRTTAPPKLSPDEQAAFMKKAKEITPRYRTELLKEA